MDFCQNDLMEPILIYLEAQVLAQVSSLKHHLENVIQKRIAKSFCATKRVEGKILA